MAAGGGAGVITVWNLDERRLHTIVKVHLPAVAVFKLLLVRAIAKGAIELQLQAKGTFSASRRPTIVQLQF